MVFQEGDVVDVYDPDEKQWYAGVVDEITWIAGHMYYAVALDRKQPLTKESFSRIKHQGEGPLPQLSLLAVPFSRPKWIRHPR